MGFLGKFSDERRGTDGGGTKSGVIKGRGEKKHAHRPPKKKRGANPHKEKGERLKERDLTKKGGKPIKSIFLISPAPHRGGACPPQFFLKKVRGKKGGTKGAPPPPTKKRGKRGKKPKKKNQTKKEVPHPQNFPFPKI
ncbi:MAG: hypothetical protein IPL55_21075 [Saprospiraceae bacterium]|nr:hypothetical protein [Saprospiraceae bacterium]